MIAFLLANRWAAEVTAVVFILALGFAYVKDHDLNEQREGYTQCESKVSVVTAQMKAEADSKALAYQQQTAEAQAKYENDVRTLPVLHVPIFLHDGAICAATVRDPKPAASVTPAPGRVDPGHGSDVDIRPTVSAFELKYEQALAQCREVLADWPH